MICYNGVSVYSLIELDTTDQGEILRDVIVIPNTLAANMQIEALLLLSNAPQEKVSKGKLCISFSFFRYSRSDCLRE